MSAPPESPEILQRYQSAADLVGIVARQVRRAVGSAVGVEELESCASEGLFDAARRFDPSRCVPFRAYAYLRIRGAVLDGVRAIMPLPRRTWARLQGLDAMIRVSASISDELSGAVTPQHAGAADAALREHLAAMATALAMGIIAQPVTDESGEVTLGDTRDDPEQATLRGESRRRVERAIAELPLAERALVQGYYLEGQRFDQVAEQLGLSKSWASRLHRRAMGRLAKALSEH